MIASAPDLARKVFKSPAFVKPCVVDVATKILRPTNWVFLDGKAHTEYRKGLNGLFTKKAIGVYLPRQERVYDEYFTKFLALSKDGHVPFMTTFRDISTAVSLRTFCGSYIKEDEIKRISDDYFKITLALELVNFPIILPFTRPWYGRKCADMVMGIFARCASLSRQRMLQGGEVSCTMDAWIKSMIDAKEYSQGADAGEESTRAPILIRDFSDEEISMTVFTLLFASQDATSSATTWLFQIMADRPDIFAKVRAEQEAVREGDMSKRLDVEMVEKMTYTRNVVRECLRLRPPVILVPYVAKSKYPITSDYSVPKGAMVIPSIYPALHDPDVYADPDVFDPDRWYPGSPAEMAKKNWLVFGTGPHVCLGQNYVLMHLAAMIGKASLQLDWTHEITPDSEKIKVFATIFPQDDCLLKFSPRQV